MSIDGKSLIKRLFGFSAGGIFGALLSFISIPIITRSIIPEEYGIYGLILAVFNIILIAFPLGLDQALIRYYYEERDNLGTLLRKCVVPIICIYIIILISAIPFWDSLSLYIFGEKNPFNLVLFIIGTFFIIVGRFMLVVVRMENKAILYSSLVFFERLIFFLIVLIQLFILNNYTVTALLVSYVFSLGTQVIVGILLTRKVWVGIFLKGNRKLKGKHLVAYGFPFAIAALSESLLFFVDKYTIRYFLSIESLGIYTAATVYITMINILYSGYVNFWTPMALKIYNNNKDNRSFFKNASQLVATTVLILGTVLISLSDILVLFLGEEYHSAIKVIPFFLIIPLLSILSETMSVGIIFSGKTKWNMVAGGISLVISIFLSCILVPRMGISGAALTLLFARYVFTTVKIMASSMLFNVEYNQIKLHTSLMLLIIYALIRSLNLFGYYNIIIGLILLCYILVMYRNNLKYYYILFKR
ncbi:hypothetical protein AC622_01010 [Bacillus sp. FJAT-27916]|uniref:lipopolysaccharide biosynthesis protein n=1 Tax=Bacillus sp. FJAT-27916 TaxID=1679169 RepID=UPI0006708F9D|nr:lipopolysaccharide biosynthesis protein [Bacillus sp. FJAT-27916]KMY43015.1 hypothetical protein AC622_01010 [Bacillus sp. FJAT-27916]